ncbi:sulfite exporter TauE/SafE family protein [Pectinatus brassicae]|uniref:Probable membrane transporter protein n=1 Tax=Pectinatus brassicae TaxID=862415 RepID=A0A840UUK0_9FIRM|nr:sulfite exporter TauE/SafE family protein [Pectinatus brassicae]MBB5336613.1 hypothetical protein [Pectinatus brassicae]
MIEITAGIITFIVTTILTSAGLGAAFILIPLYMLLGINIHVAMSTALLLNVIAMILASITFNNKKLILWKIAFPTLIAAAICSPIGVYTSQFIPRDKLILLFIIFLIFAATMMLFYKKKSNYDEHHLIKEKLIFLKGLLIGSGVGFLSGLLGIGGGNIIIPIFIWMSISPKKASGTTSFIVIFSSLSGFLSHASIGNLNYTLLIFTTIGSVAGALLGAWLMSKKLKNKHIKIIIAILLYIVAIKMLTNIL